MPLRALDLIWQTMPSNVAEMEASAGGIRQALAGLPPVAGFFQLWREHHERHNGYAEHEQLEQ